MVKVISVGKRRITPKIIAILLPLLLITSYALATTPPFSTIVTSWVWRVLGLKVDVNVYSIPMPKKLVIIEVVIENPTNFNFKGSLTVYLYKYDDSKQEWVEVTHWEVKNVEVSAGKTKVWIFEYKPTEWGYYKATATITPK